MQLHRFSHTRAREVRICDESGRMNEYIFDYANIRCGFAELKVLDYTQHGKTHEKVKCKKIKSKRLITISS